MLPVASIYQSGSRFWVLTGAANCGKRSMPSGAYCVPSMFVSQIHCIASPLCLLFTGWTNDKCSLSEEAVTVSVTCLFISQSPSNSAKRLTINCCHCILPIFTHQAYRTHASAHSSRYNSGDWDWWHRHCKRLIFFNSISPPAAGGGHKCMKAH